MVNFLVVGPGLIGQQHIRLINAHPEGHVEAIVALHPSKHEHFKQELGTSVYLTMEEAFARHQFDAAIVSSPNECHYLHTLACIERKIPVFVEKPLTDKIEDAKKLVDCAEKEGVPVLVGHHRTYSSFIPKAKEILSSEKFGRLVSVQGSALLYKPADYFVEGEWRTKKGGGPILINLIHEIGILRELCGEITRVFAFASNNFREYEVEDTVSISLQFDNGCLGTFILSDCASSPKSWEMTSGENPVYPHYPNESCYHFTGSQASLDFPGMKMMYYPENEEPSWLKSFKCKELKVDAVDPLSCQLNHFIRVVRGECEPIVSVRSGYNNMRVLEAIRQSILEDKPVDLI